MNAFRQVVSKTVHCFQMKLEIYPFTAFFPTFPISSYFLSCYFSKNVQQRLWYFLLFVLFVSCSYCSLPHQIYRCQLNEVVSCNNVSSNISSTLFDLDCLSQFSINRSLWLEVIFQYHFPFAISLANLLHHVRYKLLCYFELTWNFRITRHSETLFRGFPQGIFCGFGCGQGSENF